MDRSHGQRVSHLIGPAKVLGGPVNSDVRLLLIKVNHSSYLEKFILWASQQPAIMAVALVGSYARGTATENSDIDLIILASSSRPYLENHGWLSLFGDVDHSTNEQWGAVETVRATYQTGVEIECNFAQPSWAEVPLDAGTRRVVNDGFEILFDPQHRFDGLQKTLAEGCAIG